MNRRSAARLALPLTLVAALACGCSRQEEAKTSGPARPLSAVWGDVLAQRDIMHALFVKPLEEVTHEDCSALGAAARRVDQLTDEVRAGAAALYGGNEGQLRAIGEVIISFQGVTAKIRESALAETPGQWTDLKFPLDRSLRAIESYFTPEQLGGQSIAARPDFETAPNPPPLSPI